MSQTRAATVSVIHATPLSMPPVNQAFGEILPDVELRHVLDDSLLPAIERAGGLTGANRARLVRLVDHVLDDGETDAVLLACSSYSPVVAQLRDRHVPVLAPDESMFAKAVMEDASRIGVLVTVEAAIKPAVAKLEEKAAQQGRFVKVLPGCSPAAMSALQRGEEEAFDAALVEAAGELAERGAELLLLGQYSMTRARDAVLRATGLAVLTGPHAAAEAIRDALTNAAVQA